MRNIIITIIDHRNMRRVIWWRILASNIALVIAPIGVGIALDSAAMQWAGYIFGFLAMLGFVSRLTTTSKREGMTIQQARFHLDKLERGEI